MRITTWTPSFCYQQKGIFTNGALESITNIDFLMLELSQAISSIGRQTLRYFITLTVIEKN